jgi:hypothetical protein
MRVLVVAEAIQCNCRSPQHNVSSIGCLVLFLSVRNITINQKKSTLTFHDAEQDNARLRTAIAELGSEVKRRAASARRRQAGSSSFQQQQQQLLHHYQQQHQHQQHQQQQQHTPPRGHFRPQSAASRRHPLSPDRSLNVSPRAVSLPGNRTRHIVCQRFVVDPQQCFRLATRQHTTRTIDATTNVERRC